MIHTGYCPLKSGELARENVLKFLGLLCAISISQTPQPNMKSNEWDCIKFHRRILGDVLRFKAYRKSEIVKNNKKYGPI